MSQTVQSFANDLLDYSRVQDFGALTARDQRQLVRAINAGIAEFMDMAPHRYRQTSASETLFAPQTVSIAVTNGETEVDSGDTSTFPDRWRGCSIQIGDDSTYNEIVDGKGFLHEYRGTSGTVSATVYADAVPMQERYVRCLKSEPWIELGGQQSQRLVRSAYEHNPAHVLGTAREGWWTFHSWEWSIGHPLYYGLQHAGISRGATSQFLIRLYPVPSSAMIMQFEYDLDQITYTLDDIIDETAILLPLSDVELETMVWPLATRAFMGSPLVGESVDRTAVERAALRAEDRIRLLPQNAGVPANRVFTPRNW